MGSYQTDDREEGIRGGSPWPAVGPQASPAPGPDQPSPWAYPPHSVQPQRPIPSGYSPNSVPVRAVRRGIRHGLRGNWEILTRSETVRVWLGVAAAGVDALLILGVGLGFIYFTLARSAYVGSGLVSAVLALVGALITALGARAAYCAYGMFRLWA